MIRRFAPALVAAMIAFVGGWVSNSRFGRAAPEPPVTQLLQPAIVHDEWNGILELEWSAGGRPERMRLQVFKVESGPEVAGGPLPESRYVIRLPNGRGIVHATRLDN